LSSAIKLSGLVLDLTLFSLILELATKNNSIRKILIADSNMKQKDLYPRSKIGLSFLI
jgi:hypothetical protein